MPTRVTSNAQLLQKLPNQLAAITPTVKPTNPNFRPFYRWCFAHFRDEGAKNVRVDYATLLIQTLLDPAKYDISWQAPESLPPPGRTPGTLPHVNAFVEFLGQEPRPVQVITKDQFDQFYEFNLSVGWDLAEHSEESACEYQSSRCN